MDKQPLVTVYIPTFNRVELLKRAVESVQNQTYQNLEIIIVDDCSTDGTHDYLEQLANDDKRVRYFLKEINSGACVSRNIAIENATGEFITGLDDDDYFLKDRVEKFINLWSEKRQHSIFIFSINLIKESNEYIKYPSILKYTLSKKIIKYMDMKVANYCGNQVFMKTIDMKRYGGFDVNMPAWQDMETWYRILKLSKKSGELVDNPTYVYDSSHPHERITNPVKHVKAREFFLKKHEISEKDEKLFFLINASNASCYTLFKRLLKRLTVIDFYFLVKNLFK